jgi:putative effector of murein hydrolase LrgA (UPF0299 family)
MEYTAPATSCCGRCWIKYLNISLIIISMAAGILLIIGQFYTDIINLRIAYSIFGVVLLLLTIILSGILKHKNQTQNQILDPNEI